LSLLPPHLAKLEIRRSCGEVVRSITLDEEFVREWLGRAGGEHLFSTTHKEIVMETLAADM
jgi:hypothetical protein